eukprot:1622088-Rhodomonas_salina.1
MALCRRIVAAAVPANAWQYHTLSQYRTCRSRGVATYPTSVQDMCTTCAAPYPSLVPGML